MHRAAEMSRISVEAARRRDDECAYTYTRMFSQTVCTTTKVSRKIPYPCCPSASSQYCQVELL